MGDELLDPVQMTVELRVWHKTKNAEDIQYLVGLPTLDSRRLPSRHNETYVRFFLADSADYVEDVILHAVERLILVTELVEDFATGSARGWIIVGFKLGPPNIPLGPELVEKLSQCGLGIDLQLP